REHLYRKNYSKFQCQRCKRNFESRLALDSHAECHLACAPRARRPEDGFTFEIYEALHSKKKAFHGQTEEEK
ncbi:hypothetical protein BJ875DRAFT_390350, partial [Amylocarpus encephaloides]